MMQGLTIELKASFSFLSSVWFGETSSSSERGGRSPWQLAKKLICHFMKPQITMPKALKKYAIKKTTVLPASQCHIAYLGSSPFTTLLVVAAESYYQSCFGTVPCAQSW